MAGTQPGRDETGSHVGLQNLGDWPPTAWVCGARVSGLQRKAPLYEHPELLCDRYLPPQTD